jgi:DNA-binding NtrC family response regulator
MSESPHIIIFDDHIELAEMLSTSLQRKGYCARVVRETNEIIDHLKTNPDVAPLLLIDAYIGERLGARIAVDIKKVFPDIQIVVMSGYCSAQIEGLDVLLGNGVVRAFITKPFPVNALLSYLAA